MFTQIMENNTQFQVGRKYFYHFASNYDTLAFMQVVSISSTRKTAMIQKIYGGNPHGEPFRKKIEVYNGVEHISAGNYSMAGMWSADQFDNSQLLKDLDIDFIRSQIRIDAVKNLPELPEEASDSVYTVDISFIDEKYNTIRKLRGVALSAMVSYLEENANAITDAFGSGWKVDYTLYKNGECIDDGITLQDNPADLMRNIEAHLPEQCAEILFTIAAEFFPDDVVQELSEIVETVVSEGEEDRRAGIKMITTDPDNDPDPTKPRKNISKYPEFDANFDISSIISVSFGGASNSAAQAKKRKKKLTEREWKKQLAMKAAFEAEEKEKAEKAFNEMLAGLKIGDVIIDKDGNTESIISIERDSDYPDYIFVKTDCRNGYDDYDFAAGTVAIFTAETPETDENQITFDDVVTYSAIETAPDLPEIDEDAARRALEAYSFSDYKAGSATAEYAARVGEVRDAAETAKDLIPEEFHSELDRLVSRYARQLADWTNRKNRVDASCPSWIITGPANYPIKKHEKQMRRLDAIYSEYSDIERLYKRIINFPSEIANRPIKADDANAIEKLREKVDELTRLQDTMKRENASARKAGKGIPHAAWELSNNRQNLHRYEKRLKELERIKNVPTEKAEIIAAEGLRILRNTEIMRLQLIFDNRPDEETRKLLKSNGFKWAPSQGAWQRQLTANAEYAARRIIRTLNS